MTDRAIELALRTARPIALARLVRIAGSLEDAEEYMQDACVKAIQSWAADGVPNAPAAWLITVARNALYDEWRRRKTATQAGNRELPAAENLTDGESDDSLDFDNDDMLRLLFTCCHPRLSEANRLILSARAVAGLSCDELARALLIEPGAAEKRYTRARRQVSELEIPYEVPQAAELPERLDSVLQAVYVLFNEGYKATTSERVVRADLCQLAIGLGRRLVRLFPSEPEVMGLLALMVLQHSRVDARTHGGRIVLLADQDRDRWDRDLGIEGCALVEKALRRKRVGPYQLQAAVAALHFEAPDFMSTDWRQISALYVMLESLQPSPVVTINCAVALLYCNGPEVALELLDKLSGDRKVARYPEYHAARAEALLHQGHREQAIAALELAAELSQHPPTKAYLSGRIAGLRQSS